MVLPWNCMFVDTVLYCTVMQAVIKCGLSNVTFIQLYEYIPSFVPT
jgi:hypothetical protein